MDDPPSAASTLAPPDETAEGLFRALGRLHASGNVRLRLDFKRLEQVDSPVGVQADANRWAYAVVALALAALWLGGWLAALGIAVLGTAAYYTAGRRHVRRRLQRRIETLALVDLDLWRRLWRWGGVALVPGAGPECAAPAGNWMALVRGLTAPRSKPGRVRGP